MPTVITRGQRLTAKSIVLRDQFARVHTDLRISLIDKCNLRCTYCLPAGGIAWMPPADLLTRAEVVRLARIAACAGVRTVRLTGGEPLLRPDLEAIVRDLAAVEVAGERLALALTTNAVGLAGRAEALARAGLGRVNISLDTLDEELFAQMTRRTRLAEVLAGVGAAVAAGLDPVKINAVVQRGRNDHEVAHMVRWAREVGVTMRFIEQMPLDAQREWSRREMVTAAEILATLASEFELTPTEGRGSAPAQEYLVDGGPHRVGVIASVTRPFCGACDRLRITADGKMRNCLFSQTETDLLGPMRSGATDDEIATLMGLCVADKKAGHGIDDPDFLQPARPMSAIGG